MIVWTNNKVAFTRDLIFGICVMTEVGWYPIINLDNADFKLVMDYWDNAPGNPYADDLRRMEVARLTHPTPGGV